MGKKRLRSNLDLIAFLPLSFIISQKNIILFLTFWSINYFNHENILNLLTKKGNGA
jgi:hypothetical protein